MLTEKAVEHLSIIHQQDVLKVLLQVKIVAANREGAVELQKLSANEYDTLINLLKKYNDQLNEIK